MNAGFGQPGYTPEGAAETDGETTAAPPKGDEVAKLITEAREHLAAGVPQSAIDAVIRAVELLAGLV